ncbi:Ataxin-10 domain [Trypanosoma melophagium]|uniref:Ataxin-10 domain n=1 Tax=Trypanosoma melophagium TaxID=715481 RepID=UPI003519FCCC|nr:Ataxin-10 domain [Trypanosoma melophagium]
MSGHEGSVKEADAATLQHISSKVDALLMLCETDGELRNYSLKFKLEQAVDKTAFEAKREAGEEMLHFRRVLQRMADLALHVAPHILRRVRKYVKGKNLSQNDNLSCDRMNTDTLSTHSSSLQRSSSVEEFCDGSEAWLESGAHLSYTAIELLCLILVSHPRLVKPLQMYLFESRILEYIEDALSISREQEITFFQEGYRTEHIRLIANLTLDNEEVCSAIVSNSAILSAILTGTRFDEENPGMVQWAEFSIRNLCCCISEAREIIRRLTPISISDESKELLFCKVDCHINQAGKLAIGKSPHASTE